MIRDTIKKHDDFAMDEDDPIAKSRYFLIRAKVTKFPRDARYGLIVTKKTFKHAVDRNRAKRLLRDWIAFNEDLMLSDLDYIFIAHNCLLNCNRESGRAKVAKALDKISKSYIKNAKQ